MVELIHFSGLSDNANIILNKTFGSAVSMNSTEVNTLHLGAVLMCDELTSEEFVKLTGTDINILLDITLNKVYENFTSKDKNAKLDIANCVSQDILKVIHLALYQANKEDRECTEFDLINAVLTTDGTMFKTLLKEEGVKIKEVSTQQIIQDSVLSSAGDNMNEMVQNKKLDPIIGRDEIIDKIIEILGRKNKSNPCLIGEPGVGKTAIVEGLVQRIESGNVPSYLKGVQVYNIDMNGLVAGCTLRGQFEEKMKQIIQSAKKNKNCILFFDEMHMLMTLGSSSKDEAINGANILKPILARGEVKIIGTTTLKEYKKFIEVDSAFDRRIQRVIVPEPSINEAIDIINKGIGVYEDFHNVSISSEVIKEAVELSDRYITDKKLPDKAITILDETASRLKAKDEGNNTRMTVDDVKYTISKTTGINITSIGKSDKEKLLGLSQMIGLSVVGQDNAIESVVKAIKRNKVGIINNERPIGSFLFVGPTGVGKTELCKALARELFGSEKALIRFDMSEYMEKHSVSKLIGAPPGYKGCEAGGLLTEKVKRNPYSIVLLDEIEKAHTDVLNILLQVLDDGILTDNQGDTVDFKNTIIIMTSNSGYGNIEQKKSIGFNQVDSVEEKIDNRLEEVFKPEFLNRLDKVIKFNSLSKSNIKDITKNKLAKIARAMLLKEINIEFSSNIVDYLVDTGFSKKYGARNINRIIQDTIEDYLSELILEDKVGKGDSIQLDYRDGKLYHKNNSIQLKV